MKIVGIKGKAGSGKDTIGSFIIERLINLNMCPKRYAFADGVKDVASCMSNNERYLFDQQFFKRNCYFSLTDGGTYYVEEIPEGHETISIRELLQKIGTEAMQSVFGKSIWVNKTFSEIQSDCESKKLDIAIITDVRFKHEYDAIKSKNGIILEIINPNNEYSDTHVSETDLDNIPADYVIINDWINNPYNLNSQLDEFVQQIKG